MVLLLADDLGYQDLSVQGATDIPTPNIDRIAKDGVRFTQAYVVSPLCSASRGAIMTGRYPMRWGQEFNPGVASGPDSAFGIPHDVPILSERLKSLGYATAIFGKWHLGSSQHEVPTARGFDAFYGFLTAQHYYSNAWWAFPVRHVEHGTDLERAPPFLTGALADAAVSFIDQHAQEPFFVYVPFNAVHEPITTDPVGAPLIHGVKDPVRRAYATMVSGMDVAVGRILAALEQRGLTDHTLVIFLSDNGGPHSTGARNEPLRGVKGQMMEGGIRVPMVMKWPGMLPPRVDFPQVVSALDLVPTIMAAVGNPVHADVDGVDLLPFLQAAGPFNRAPHDTLYWRLGPERAIRAGHWKALWNSGRLATLTDLSADLGETRNLQATYPDTLARLHEGYARWEAQMQPPKWGVHAFRADRVTEAEH